MRWLMWKRKNQRLRAEIDDALDCSLQVRGSNCRNFMRECCTVVDIWNGEVMQPVTVYSTASEQADPSALDSLRGWTTRERGLFWGRTVTSWTPTATWEIMESHWSIVKFQYRNVVHSNLGYFWILMLYHIKCLSITPLYWFKACANFVDEFTRNCSILYSSLANGAVMEQKLFCWCLFQWSNSQNTVKLESENPDIYIVLNEGIFY